MVDQPMLNVAQTWPDIATADAVQGQTDQVKLSNAAARIALKVAAQDPAHRTAITQNVPASRTRPVALPSRNRRAGNR